MRTAPDAAGAEHQSRQAQAPIQVRIGVHAPGDVAIHREEIYDRVCRERGTERLPQPEEDSARQFA